MNGVCGFGFRTLARLFICSGLNPAEQGWRSGPRWVLLSHQGQLSRETGGGGEEGWAKERGQTAWLGDVEPINFPLQPISHVLSLCPFLLMTHFLCPSAHFQARVRKKERRWRCVHRPQCCTFVLACREGERALPRVVRAGFCQTVLSPRTVSGQTRGPSGELHSSSSPPSVPAEVAPSKALSVHNALEASSSWQPPLPPSTPASAPANQKRHIRMSKRTHTCAQTHTRGNLLIKKCIS